MDRDEVLDLIREELANQQRQTIRQADIPAQTIKERHIDWEEFTSTLRSSSRAAVSAMIKTSSTYSVSSTLANAEAYSVWLKLEYSDDASRSVLGVWHSNFYETSAVSANRIPDGASITNGDYRWYVAPGWQGLPSAGKTLGAFWLLNQSGGSKTVLFRSRVRYIGQTAT